MQISTNSNGTGAPLPASQRPGGQTPAPPDAPYSPLLECPCTTRIVKNLTANTIDGRPFTPDCLPEPVSDLNATGNPTCDLETYSGGLDCCYPCVT